MRSQGTKPQPKKGAITKTNFKQHSPTKQVKKKVVSVKKVKTIIKNSILKSPKKTIPKDVKKQSNEKVQENNESTPNNDAENNLPSTSEFPPKQIKNENKEKKIPANKVNPLNVKKKTIKTSVKIAKKPKINNRKEEISSSSGDEIKYKINSQHMKRKSPAKPKAKSPAKRTSPAKQQKKATATPKSDSTDAEDTKPIEDSREENKDKAQIDKASAQLEPEIQLDQNNIKSHNDSDNDKNVTSNNEATAKTPPSNNLNKNTKSDLERPPKFFTSHRPPRNVEVDLKTCKTLKANVTLAEKFLSIKPVETKDEEISKVKSTFSPGSQDSEVDVYTFTDYKVDSPKSILSDLRNPINRNVGRVRPIARVKGTVINRNKLETEKKKYSPHRPIEEVVKQLKAGKKAEEAKHLMESSLSDSSCTNSMTAKDDSGDSKDIPIPSPEEKPKPSVVSKSYKMVARKTNIPGLVAIKPQASKVSDGPSPNNDINKNKKSVDGSGKKSPSKSKKGGQSMLSDEEMENSTFSINTSSKSHGYTSSDESASESSGDTKDSSESDGNKKKKNVKNKKKHKKITDSDKKSCKNKELKNLSPDSFLDLSDPSILGEEKPSKRRLKLLSMWTGPKRHRMASLNAMAKVHCLYENESRTHMELGLMKTLPGTMPAKLTKKKSAKTETPESASESEYEKKDKAKTESSEDDSPPASTRTLRVIPGSRGAGKYWDPKSSTSSSEDSELDYKNLSLTIEKKKPVKPAASKSDSEKPPPKMKKTTGVPIKKKRSRNEVVMDLKDMVVQKRMASLNATAILAASYERRSPKSSKDSSTTSDSCSDESIPQKSKNGVASGVKSEVIKKEECKKETDDPNGKQKVEVIVNQDTDVTITGVYATHHHEGFCTTVSGMQYRISSTSHTQTTATAAAETEGSSKESPPNRYTPLTALSSMQPPPADQSIPPVHEIGGLGRRPGCASAFSAPSPAAHHEPGYYQPAGPLIKESAGEAERALARYHPHYHAHSHPPVLSQYGPGYYGPDLCYGRYYRPPAPPAYHMPPPQPESQMVGMGAEYGPPAGAPQYYSAPPPCYQHTPQRLPYMEYRGCPCPMNACPKNVHIGPATGNPPTGAGPVDGPSAPALPGGAFRVKARAAHPGPADPRPPPDSGKDPPEVEPPAAADAPRLHSLGLSPKRELYAEARESLRLAGDTPGPAEAVGPPSPARGSAGVCAPQPPPVQRRARLGKAMARKTLTGDDTSLLITQRQPVRPQSADDDVVALSSPEIVPIDLSSSDETDRREPLVDVKKENEGPIVTPARKPDAIALREHNSTALPVEPVKAVVETPKAPVKRRYSRPKLEIDMKDVELPDTRQTNGIGEHVKLQKRRKISAEMTEPLRLESINESPKKKPSTPRTKRSPKTPASPEKKTFKRKTSTYREAPPAKKLDLCVTIPEVSPLRLDDKEVETGKEQDPKPKNTSAMLLDKLIRKNSVDRPEEHELNPAELFAPTPLNGVKKILNINNNVVTETVVNGARHTLDEAVPKLISAKVRTKSPKTKPQSDIVITTAEKVAKPRKSLTGAIDKSRSKKVCENERLTGEIVNAKENPEKSVQNKILAEPCDRTIALSPGKTKKAKLETAAKSTIQKLGAKLLEKVSKLASEKSKLLVDAQAEKQIKVAEKPPRLPEKIESPVENAKPALLPEKAESENLIPKHLSEKSDAEKVKCDKLAKLLVPKKLPSEFLVQPSDIVEEACASPTETQVSVISRRSRRRRSGGRRHRRIPLTLDPPAVAKGTPRWSNGWTWEGEPYLSKVYLNNDSRLDSVARCWGSMRHEGGDRIVRGDCVLLRAGRGQPFVARVARLWENPNDGEMMVSLVWYYRPEHTESGRRDEDAPDEVFASRHRDANSVACIEDKCHVLTYNEYCRYKKRLRAAEEGITVAQSIVPPMPPSEITSAVATNDSKVPPGISPDLVLFCRKVYDFRSKKIQIPNK